MTLDCPRCGRHVGSYKGRINRHGITAGSSDICPMSWEAVPVHGTTPADYESRAALIGNLAWRLRDCDPSSDWDVLTTMPAAELQRLLMVALAAVPVDRSIGQSMAWVTELPAARWVS